ncbi:hypothetical protein HDU67_002798 [Dinochytrium kinnereticum]|nr:hypothetical protein HDU67_002798 [Dinochytrium kinnereticum]
MQKTAYPVPITPYSQPRLTGMLHPTLTHTSYPTRPSMSSKNRVKPSQPAMMGDQLSTLHMDPCSHDFSAVLVHMERSRGGRTPRYNPYSTFINTPSPTTIQSSSQRVNPLVYPQNADEPPRSVNRNPLVNPQHADLPAQRVNRNPLVNPENADLPPPRVSHNLQNHHEATIITPPNPSHDLQNNNLPPPHTNDASTTDPPQHLHCPTLGCRSQQQALKSTVGRYKSHCVRLHESMMDLRGTVVSVLRDLRRVSGVVGTVAEERILDAEAWVEGFEGLPVLPDN